MIYLDDNGVLVSEKRYSVIGSNRCSRNTVETGTYIPFFRIKSFSDVYVLPENLCGIYINHVTGYEFDGTEIVHETSVYVNNLEYIVNILRAYEIWWMIVDEIDSPDTNMWDEDSDNSDYGGVYSD